MWKEKKGIEEKGAGCGGKLPQLQDRAVGSVEKIFQLGQPQSQLHVTAGASNARLAKAHGPASSPRHSCGRRQRLKASKKMHLELMSAGA